MFCFLFYLDDDELFKLKMGDLVEFITIFLRSLFTWHLYANSSRYIDRARHSRLYERFNSINRDVVLFKALSLSLSLR